MLFGITLAMGPAIAHQSWNTVVKRVSADGGPRSVNRSSPGQPSSRHACAVCPLRARPTDTRETSRNGSCRGPSRADACPTSFR